MRNCLVIFLLCVFLVASCRKKDKDRERESARNRKSEKEREREQLRMSGKEIYIERMIEIDTERE